MELAERQFIEQLIAMVAEEGLDELTVESAGTVISVKAEKTRATESELLVGPTTSSARPAGRTEATTVAALQSAVPSGQASPANLVHITSPMVGVFYRAPSPDSPPFVEVGSVVEDGQTVGLVEAMKVFNEIVAEMHGRVVALPAQNAQLVQHGETLVILERL